MNGSRKKCVLLLLIFQKALREFFPRFGIILEHEDVLSFVYGLSDHPHDVIDLIYDRGAKSFAELAILDYENGRWDEEYVHELFYPHSPQILDYIRDLIRKVKAEKIEKDTSKEQAQNRYIQNRYLSVCNLDCSDFILSRTYVIMHSSGLSCICPDTTTNYGHGAKNDPMPYVIVNPHGDRFFRPLVKIIRTLCHRQKIVITRVYSKYIYLKENNLNLEGDLVLGISSEHCNDIFHLIKEISLVASKRIVFTGLKMILPDKKKVNEICFEKVPRWVNFRSKIKALKFHGFKLPVWLIEHIAQELYGEVEFSNSDATLPNVMTVPTPTEQRAKGSPLERLSFNSMFTQDIETLLRLNHLPQLRVLDLGGFDTHRLGVLLGSGSPSLEELTLKYVTLSKQDTNTFLDILTNGGFPKLNCLNLYGIVLEFMKIPLPEVKPRSKNGLEISHLERLAKLAYRKELKDVFLSLSDVKSLSKYGLDINRLKSLTKLECWKEVTEVYLSLEKDLLCKTKLNQADTRSLIQTVLPTIAELDLSNSSLIDCLKSDIVLNLKVLDLSNSNPCSISDVRMTLTSILDSKLDLRRLKKLNLSKNTLTDSLGVLLANESMILETLLLEDTKLSVSDVQALSEAGIKIEFLKTLNLSKNTLTGSLEFFLRYGCVIYLETLLLEDTRLSVRDVRALSRFGWRDLSTLQTLNLSQNTLTDSLGLLLAEEFESLHTLLLEDTKLSATDVQVLSTAARQSYSQRLQTVNLSQNTLTDSLGFLLANEFECLHTLFLEDTKLCASDVQALSTAASDGKLFRLTTLNLSKNILTDTLPDLLKGDFRLLETLLLEDTKLSVSDVRALSTAVQEGKLKRLETLDLSKNILTDVMCDLVKCTFEYLKELFLVATKLSVSDVRALSMASWLRELKTLNLSKNILTESLVLFLDNKIHHLEILLLEDTGLSTKDILALSSAVREGKLPVLQHLNISQQNVGDLELAVTDLIQSCAIDIDRLVQVRISLGSFRREFQNDVQSICVGSKVDVF